MRKFVVPFERAKGAARGPDSQYCGLGSLRAMASFEQHCLDCLRFLGSRCEAVNLWMDEYFKVYGPQHRRWRHHRQGLEEADRRFGIIGRKAATIHVLRDCRNIPTLEDYETGQVDVLGLRRHWPVSAYIHYSEEDFQTLVNNEFLGNIGRVLIAFVGPDASKQFLSGLSRLSPPEVEKLIEERWPRAQEKRSSLPPLGPAVLPTAEMNDKVAQYLQKIQQYESIRAQFGHSEFGFVNVADLVNPLVLIDGEYLDSLRAELQGTDELDLVRFALPEKIRTHVRGMIDPSGRSVIFISNEKTLGVQPLAVSNTDLGGAQVTLGIVTNPGPIIVSSVGDRLVLRNGIHRAFLLASAGYSQIPALLIREDALPSFVESAYPAFTPSVLALGRPPLLMDFLDDDLTVGVPMLRTRKVVRITVDELVLPVD